MPTIEEIKKAICKKITFVTGDDFELDRCVDVQIAEIKENLDSAYKQAEAVLSEQELQCFLKGSQTDEVVRKKVNRTVCSFYKRTHSFVEKKYWREENDYRPTCSNFDHWYAEMKDFSSYLKKECEYFWDIIENSTKYLKEENLDEVNRYFINISYGGHIYNTANSLRSYHYNFHINIYLFSNHRVIKLVLDRNKLLSSKEQIIKKDLKKVEIRDDIEMRLHYHGLHDPDILILDNYEMAVQLRKKISELREGRFTNNKSDSFNFHTKGLYDKHKNPH